MRIDEKSKIMNFSPFQYFLPFWTCFTPFNNHSNLFYVLLGGPFHKNRKKNIIGHLKPNEQFINFSDFFYRFNWFKSRSQLYSSGRCLIRVTTQSPGPPSMCTCECMTENVGQMRRSAYFNLWNLCSILCDLCHYACWYPIHVPVWNKGSLNNVLFEWKIRFTEKIHKPPKAGGNDLLWTWWVMLSEYFLRTRLNLRHFKARSPQYKINTNSFETSNLTV